MIIYQNQLKKKILKFIIIFIIYTVFMTDTQSNHFLITDAYSLKYFNLNNKQIQNQPFTPLPTKYETQLKNKTIHTKALIFSKKHNKSQQISSKKQEAAQQLKYSYNIRKLIGQGKFFVIDTIDNEAQDPIKVFKTLENCKKIMNKKSPQFQDHMYLQENALRNKEEINDLLKQKVFKHKKNINQNYTSNKSKDRKLIKKKDVPKSRFMHFQQQLISLKKKFESYSKKLSNNPKKLTQPKNQRYKVSQDTQQTLKPIQFRNNTNKIDRVFPNQQNKTKSITSQFRSINQSQKKRPNSTLDQYRNSYRQLSNLQKYNIGIKDYFRKKTRKRIEDDYCKNMKRKSQSMIMQYQQYILERLQISQMSKQNILKSFKIINSQSERCQFD